MQVKITIMLIIHVFLFIKLANTKPKIPDVLIKVRNHQCGMLCIFIYFVNYYFISFLFFDFGSHIFMLALV